MEANQATGGEAGVKELLDLAASEDVEATVIGHFGTEDQQLILHYEGTEVGRLSMDFLHNGLPRRSTKAVAIRRGTGSVAGGHGQDARATLKERLLAALSHPNVASKHWIIRQYDHEVQGGSVVKPLTGPLQVGPSDAAVLRPKLSSYKGVALGCGLAPHIEDPYEMALAAIDEAIRNVVAVGADPAKIAILDNFCWPSVDDPITMGALARACEACHDAARAYGIPFISGKDSLHNQFTNQETGQVIRIPNTLLISAIAVLEDVRHCVTMDLKEPGDRLILVRPTGDALTDRANVHRAIRSVIAGGMVRACHDVSDGGTLVAAAEMCIASGLGATLQLDGIDPFSELPGMYVLAVKPADVDDVLRRLASEATARNIGRVDSTPRLLADGSLDVGVGELTAAWLGTLDW